MPQPNPNRRTVLAGTAAAAALTALAAAPGTAHAADRVRGPGRAAPYRWRNVAVGGTGFLTGVLFHPRVKGLAYARTDIGGAYRWSDSTGSWTPLTDHLGWDDWNLLGVEAMAVDPAHPDRLYLALGTYAQPWAPNAAVLRSSDRGATWSRTDLTVKAGANEDGRGTGERLLVDPADTDTLWLGTRHDGLLVSRDRGATWAPSPFPATPSPTGQGVTFLAAAGRRLYAGWGDGEGAHLYRRNGATWEPVPGQPAGTSAEVPIHGAYDARTRALYVTYANTPGPNNQTDGSVHRLDTTTGTWTDVTPLKPSGADAFGYGGLSVDAGRAGTAVVSTNNRWGAVDTLFRTTDGGASWTSLRESAVLDVSETPYLKWGEPQPKFGWWIQTVAVDPFDSRHVVYGTGATLYGTRDLVHWAPQIKGLEEASVRQLLSPPTGEAHLISGLADLGVMYHERLTASPSRGMADNPVMGTSTGLAQAAGRPAYVVRTGWGDRGNGAYSLDGGRSWAPFAAQPAGARDAPGPIAANADGTVLLWSLAPLDGSTPRTHRSRDNGASWTEVAGFPRGGAPLADPLDPAVFYAYAAGTLWASTDRGSTFTARAGQLPNGAGKLAVTPGRKGHLWLSAQDGGLHRSTDGGATFTRLPGCRSAHALGFGRPAPGASHPALFLVGAVDGVPGGDRSGMAILRSDDEGRTWLRVNDDAHQWGWTGETVTGDPRIHGRVYVATNGRGIQYGDPA